MKSIIALFPFAAILLLAQGCLSRPPEPGTSAPAQPTTQASTEITADTILRDDGVFQTRLTPAGQLGIARRLPPADFSVFEGHGKISVLPHYVDDPEKQWQVDLRSCDLSALDVSDRLSDLLHADFDSVTRWPAALPDGFDPDHIMQLGKDPGLGIKGLHAQGITGKGIGIAIIDQSLLTDRVEYADRLRLYEEIHWAANSPASMHAPAVASIALGKTVGVAPEADLYFIAEWHGFTGSDGSFVLNLSPMAQAIDRIVEVNAGLDKEHRIRVISISLGVNPRMGNYAMAQAAIDKAEAQGIHVLYVGSSEYMGMGRDPLADPDDFRSYGPGAFWAKEAGRSVGGLMIPMDARCTASPTGANDYVFYREGGMSWAVPYLAGLYALACQVAPDVTWEQFWATALETAVTTTGTENGSERVFGRIVNPAALIEAVRAAR